MLEGGIPSEYLQLISKFSTVVKEDENVDVVYAVLEGYQKILKHIPQIVHNPAVNGALIAGVVKMVITEKVQLNRNFLLLNRPYSK